MSGFKKFASGIHVLVLTPPRVPLPRFEVQTRFHSDHWENCWRIDDAPATYCSRAEAEAALEAYLVESAEAVASGDLADSDEREDFRIVEVVP